MSPTDDITSMAHMTGVSGALLHKKFKGADFFFQNQETSQIISEKRNPHRQVLNFWHPLIPPAHNLGRRQGKADGCDFFFLHHTAAGALCLSLAQRYKVSALPVRVVTLLRQLSWDTTPEIAFLCFLFFFRRFSGHMVHMMLCQSLASTVMCCTSDWLLRHMKHRCDVRRHQSGSFMGWALALFWKILDNPFNKS